MSRATIGNMQSQSSDPAWGRFTSQQHAMPTTEEVRQPKSRPTSQSRDTVWNSVKIMLCGGVSGAVAKTCTAPLARLTILYQVQNLNPVMNTAGGSSSASLGSSGTGSMRTLSMIQAFRNVVTREGILSLWKGNFVTIIHRVPYSAANFGIYEFCNTQLHPHIENDVARRMTAGALSGLGACTVAYPLDLLRSRMAAETLSVSAYTGIRSSLGKIVQEEGLRGLYKGLGATLIQVVPTLSMSFTFYDTLKHWVTEPGQAPTAAASLTCGCVSGFLTSTFTYPLDMVRRRMQVHKKGSLHGGYSYMETWNHVIRYGGMRALYAGIIPEYCKVLPGMAIAFGTYETLKHYTGCATGKIDCSKGGNCISSEEEVGAPLVDASQI